MLERSDTARSTISVLSKRICAVLLSAAVIISMCSGTFDEAYADAEEPVRSEALSGGDTSGDPGEGSEEGAADSTDEAGEAGDGSADTEPGDGTADQEVREVSEQPADSEEPEVPELVFKRLSSRSINAKSLGINLRTMIGEPNAGYAVAQGAATDGTYAYYLMVKSSNQKARVVKTTLDGRLVKAGPVISTHHGNGMTYNSKTHQLVAVGFDKWRQQLSFIDPESLELKSQREVSYPHKFRGLPSEAAYDNGLAGIAYVEKYNVYLARSRGYCSYDKTGTNKTIHNLWVFNADTLEAIGHINTTTIAADYPVVWQSMDADEKYVYYLVSPGSGQPHNVVICLDWNSEMLDPVLSGEQTYVENMWACNDNGSGKPDAVMTLSITKESEGLFHTRTIDEEGTVSNHFYVSEYKGVQKYKTLSKKVKYKVKWKKVKKKVKWKKVKIKNGKNKGKYKWKYKTKKVWKYKTKYKTVKYKVKDYKARDVYVYDLGEF